MSARKIMIVVGSILCVLMALGLLFPVIHEGCPPVSNRQRSQLTMQYLLTAADGFRIEYGDWPKGNTAQIARTLSGGNPKKIVFLQLEPRSINPRGEPIDAWGTAIKLSFAGERGVAVCAGKDKTYGTTDDINLSKP